MKRHEYYILPASEQIRGKLAEPRNGLQVPEVYKGYIASFANSIRQSGLIAAVSFYTSKGAKEKTTDYRRNCFLDAIYSLIRETGDSSPTLIEHVLTRVYPGI